MLDTEGSAEGKQPLETHTLIVVCRQKEHFFKDTLFFWDIFFCDAFLHQINGLEIQADPICSLWEDLRG